MAQPAAKTRRRIVPEQIVSPGADDRRAQLEEAGGGSDPVGPILLQEQRELADWAREHLGPDRKVFLDLTDVAANTEVDWRKLLKERGVQKPSKAAAPPADAAGTSDDPLLLRGRTGRQDTTWTRMLAKLEATYCVGAASEEESEFDGWGDDSDSDAEEEGGEGGASKDDGDGGAGDGNTTGGEGGAAGGKKEGGKKKERGAGGDYDYFDEFIDDEEFLELLEYDKRKPKHTGFFISKGEIERTEEMLPGFEELGKAKKGGKRKADEDAGGIDSEGGAAVTKEGKAPGEKKKRKAGEGGEAGAASESDKPAKKKKKVVAGVSTAAGAAPAGPLAPDGADAAAPANLSVAQLARMAGQMAAAGAVPAAPAEAAAEAAEVEAGQRDGSHLSSPLRQQTQQTSQAPTPSKKKGPYEMPAAVRGAIDDIRRVAAREEAPPPPAPGEKPKKRRVPKAVGDAIDAFSPLFCQQETEWGRTATNRILEALEFLGPFITKASLSQRLRNKEKPEKKSAAGASAAGTAAAGAGAATAPKAVSTDQLRQLIAAKVQGKPVTSDDDFVVVPPRASTSPPTQATQAGDASGPAPAASSVPAKPQAWKALDRDVKDQVYQYFKERSEGKAPHPTLMQEVYHFFPPNSIAPDDLREIWKAGRAKERRAEKAAAEAAAAAAAAVGQPAPAAGGEAAQAQVQQAQQQQSQPQQAQQQMPQAAAQQQQAQQQVPQAAALQQQVQHAQQEAQSQAATSPEALMFADLAVAAARKKIDSPAQPQQQQRQGAGAPVLTGAVAAASPQAGVQQVAAQAAAAASGQPAAAGHTLIAGGSPMPMPSQQTAAANVASPAAPQPRSQSATPAEGEADDDDNFQPAIPDEELVASMVRFGGTAEQGWDALKQARSSKYALAFTRVLMLVGQEGTGATEAVRLGKQHGVHNLDGKNATTSFSKMGTKPWIAHIGRSKYALKCLPGVVDVPKHKLPAAKAPGKKSGKSSKAPSGEAASAAEAGDGREEDEVEAEGSVDEETGEASEVAVGDAQAADEAGGGAGGST